MSDIRPHMDEEEFDLLTSAIRHIEQKLSAGFQVAAIPIRGGYSVSTPKFKETQEAA